MSVALELQASLHAALVNDSTLTALVPAENIGESVKTAALPCIRIGHFIEAPAGLSVERKHVRLAADVSIFARESGTSTVRFVADLIREATAEWGNPLPPGMSLVDWRWEGTRTARDGADSSLAHAVISFSALVEVHA